jgi:hypothetical protein
MKNLFLFILTLILFVSLSATALGQIITLDNFNYSDNSLLSANGWVVHSGTTNPIAVGASNGLTYTGYSGLAGVTGVVEGNAAKLVNTGEDVSLLFTTVSSGTIYYSFLVNVTTGTAGYFLHLGNSATTFAARVFVKPSVNSGKINFGISNTSTASYAATPTDFSTSTTYLIIVKYDVSTTGSLSLWVKASGVPSTEIEAGTPENTTSGTGQATLERICLRQYDANQRIVVDGIRVGQTWASILPASGLNQPPSITNVSRVTFVPATGVIDSVKATITDDHVITSAKLHVRVNGGNFDSTLTMTRMTDTTRYAVEIPASKHVANGDLVEYFISAVDDTSAYTSTESSPQGYFVGDAPISSIKAQTLTTVSGYGARINGTINVTTNVFSNGSGYMQDATGGMRIFMSGMPTLQAGRNAKIEGTVAARYNAFQLTTPNFSFVDTLLGTSTITPVTITLPTTHSATAANEGKVVKIVGVSTDTIGTFAAAGTYPYVESDNDTILVYVESNGTANTIVGRTIPTTAIDAIGVLAFYNTFMELKPRKAEDFGLSGADGSGTATITPTSRLINLTAVAETLTVTGNGIYALEGVSVQIPSTWTWTNTSSYAISEAGFSGALASLSGDGSIGNPHIITITGAAVTNLNIGTVRIFNLNTPASAALTTFTTKTRGAGGVLTAIATSPTVNITTLTYEAVATGNWSNPATWSAGIVPGASDNATMTTLGVTVTIDIPNAQCNNLTMTGSGSSSNSGPLLQFDATGTRQLTVNGYLKISGGSGPGSGDRGGRAKFYSNANTDAVLIIKKNIEVNSSNTIANGNAGLNMDEGTVKLLGATSDTLKNGSGLRLGNLEIGDGVSGKILVSDPTTDARVAVNSIKIKSSSTLVLGTSASAYVNTFGNYTETGIPMLSGGIIVDHDAFITVNNTSSGSSSAFFNIKAGGLTNTGSINFVSANKSRKYNVAFGGLNPDTSATKQSYSGSGSATFANARVGGIYGADTLVVNSIMQLDTLNIYVKGELQETSGKTVVGLARTIRKVDQSVNNTFGGIGVEINATSAAPDTTTVIRITGVTQSGNGKQSIKRAFDISPKVNTGLNATLVFKYDNTELDGQDANTLQLFKSTDGGTTWSEESGVVNTTLRTLTKTAVNSFSRWTASDAAHNIGGMFSFGVSNGWNMVSVPVTATDYRKTILFQYASSNAFAFQNSYINKDTLTNGIGYWLKYGSAQSVPMAGSPRASDSVDVSSGWNMIGSVSIPISTASVTAGSGVNISSQFYKYQSGYAIVDTIFPGRGYWVKVSAPGKLYFNKVVTKDK